MKFESSHSFIARLKAQLHNLPGEEAQYMMAPLKRLKTSEYQNKLADAPKSAVCICIFEDNNEYKIILIQRSEYKGAHGGQVSFPGGKPENNDKDLFHTAVREFEEETGVDRSNLELIGELTHLYIPASNFLVFPYLTYSNIYPNFKPSEREVAAIILLPVKDLLNDKIIKITKIPLFNQILSDVPYFDINGKIVWGATAMILSELKQLFLKIKPDQHE